MESQQMVKRRSSMHPRETLLLVLLLSSFLVLSCTLEYRTKNAPIVVDLPVKNNVTATTGSGQFRPLSSIDMLDCVDAKAETAKPVTESVVKAPRSAIALH